MNDIFKLPPKEVDISLILFSVVNIDLSSQTTQKFRLRNRFI